MKSKLRFTIAAKIFIILGVITIASFIMGIYAFVSTKSAGTIASNISNIYINIFAYNTNLNNHISEIRRVFNSYIVNPTQENYDTIMNVKKKC